MSRWALAVAGYLLRRYILLDITLSEREREILGLMAEGRSNLSIAQCLVVSERTVESHVGTIFQKLGLANSPDDHRRVLAVLAYLRT